METIYLLEGLSFDCCLFGLQIEVFHVLKIFEYMQMSYTTHDVLAVEPEPSSCRI